MQALKDGAERAMRRSLAWKNARRWTALVLAVLLLRLSLALLGCAQALGRGRLIGPEGLELVMGWSAGLVESSIRIRCASAMSARWTPRR